MITRRLLFIIVSVLLMVTGCATIGKSEDPSKTQYRIASDECVRFGLRRGSYDFKKCLEKRLKTEMK